ncbi:MAG: tRNA threonylcarbamoyladenosine dehydratase [Treponema sp.]|nr:tRNA threonylcarbamoyladenosine dehydratase [Treponema sp.]
MNEKAKNFPEQFSKTAQLLGNNAIRLLNKSKIAIFGLGGVGSYALEALARVGIGSFILVDNDTVSESNINRQLLALHSTVGKLKVDVAKERILDINPNVNVQTFACFYLPENASNIDLSSCDYVIDCIDTVTAKVFLAEHTRQINVPIISSMGTGNKLDATKLEITQIEKTHTCPLAKVLRTELRKRNIKNLKVVYSTEKPQKNLHPPASISYVPSCAGLLLAQEVIKDLLNY